MRFAKLVRRDTQSQLQQGIGRPGGYRTPERLARLLVVSSAQRVPGWALQRGGLHYGGRGPEHGRAHGHKGAHAPVRSK